MTLLYVTLIEDRNVIQLEQQMYLGDKVVPSILET